MLTIEMLPVLKKDVFNFIRNCYMSFFFECIANFSHSVNIEGEPPKFGELP